MALYKFVQKLQGQSEETRKVILWGVTGVVGILLLLWWLWDVKNSIQDSSNSNLEEQLQLQSLQEDLGNIQEELSDGGQ